MTQKYYTFSICHDYSTDCPVEDICIGVEENFVQSLP